MNQTTAQRDLQPVTHPIAFDADGRLVDVTDAERGAQYICVHCGRRVAPSRGDKLQWHYRHLEVSRCAPRSDLLLEIALKAIREAFRNALNTETTYLLSLPCRYCPKRLDRDLAALFDRAEIEVATSVGQRDRLVFTSSHRESAILQVIVLVGSDTVPAMTENDPPAVSVPVTRDNLLSLSGKLVADQYIAPTSLRCRRCHFIEMPQKTDYPIAPVTEDRFGAPLYPEMAGLVDGAAIKLRDLGFRQSAAKPYLLYRVFGGDVSGVVFADFGGLKRERIWEARGGRLYGRFSNADEHAVESLLGRVAAICEAHNIPLSWQNPQGEGE